ncbi:hypothetical protein Ciccas_002867 [Cichlidogyrus casuarinus]|uniref:Uncharacterized protein n=1 Tax=Cichlidogyrus casuarinus TaxID=1844966 RepID=A0ABD2QGZ7_9PLAT
MSTASNSRRNRGANTPKNSMNSVITDSGQLSPALSTTSSRSSNISPIRNSAQNSIKSEPKEDPSVENQSSKRRSQSVQSSKRTSPLESDIDIQESKQNGSKTPKLDPCSDTASDHLKPEELSSDRKETRSKSLKESSSSSTPNTMSTCGLGSPTEELNESTSVRPPKRNAALIATQEVMASTNGKFSCQGSANGSGQVSAAGSSASTTPSCATLKCHSLNPTSLPLDNCEAIASAPVASITSLLPKNSNLKHKSTNSVSSVSGQPSTKKAKIDNASSRRGSKQLPTDEKSPRKSPQKSTLEQNRQLHFVPPMRPLTIHNVGMGGESNAYQNGLLQTSGPDGDQTLSSTAENGQPLLATMHDLLEWQWDQAGSLLMQQAEGSDVVALLNCLHQLKAENDGLENKCLRLQQKRDHLKAVNARLQTSLNNIEASVSMHNPIEVLDSSGNSSAPALPVTSATTGLSLNPMSSSSALLMPAPSTNMTTTAPVNGSMSTTTASSQRTGSLTPLHETMESNTPPRGASQQKRSSLPANPCNRQDLIKAQQDILAQQVWYQKLTQVSCTFLANVEL